MRPSVHLVARSYVIERSVRRMSNARSEPADGCANVAVGKSPCNAAAMHDIAARDAGRGQGEASTSALRG
jgi:hypothetical protein